MKSNQDKSGGETRRSFIAKTAKLAAAVSAANLLKPTVYGQAPSANVTGANEKIVVGLIGVGKQGMTHLKSLKAHADENRIVIGGVCDLYKKHLDEAVKAVALTESNGFADHRKLLEKKDIDCIVAAPVDNWHAQVSIDAMEAGKHVYCEKPMTRYVAEGWDVYDTVQRTKKIYQCGSQYTADPMIHEAAKWIKAGKLGPLVWAQGSYCRNNRENSEWLYKNDPEGEANPKTIDWQRWQGKAKKVDWDPQRYFSWHLYYDYNSGLLGNLMSHRFYPLMKATGNPEFPRRICCTGTRKISDKPKEREITDTTHVLAEFPSGLTFLIVGSTVNEINLPDMIRGRNATLYLSSTSNKLELKPERIFAEQMDVEEFSNPQSYGKIEHLEKNFFDCIRSGETPFCNVDLSVKANTTICLAEMAERLGLTLFFDEKTRKITTGEGKVIPPLTYDSVVPTLAQR